MLAPKRVLHRKVQRGSMKGQAKGNTELRDMVQETLNEMAADGTVDEIVAGYAEYNLPEMLIIGKDK